MGRSPFWLALALASGLWVTPHEARAQFIDQIHIRTGMVNSSVGASTGGGGVPASVMPSFEFESETFKTDRKSLIFHGVLAQDMATALTVYEFAGFGYRTYLGTRGSPEISTSPEVSVIVRPNFRTYTGWEFGMSNNLAYFKTASIQASSTAFDGGVYYGMLHQMSQNVAFDAQFAINFAFGFSAVAASGMVMKIMFGVAYSL